MNLKFVFSIVVLIAANNVYALECNTKSPEFIADGDAYYTPKLIERLLPEEQNALEHINEILDGKWEGKSTELECRGSVSNPVIRTRQANVEDVELFENSNYAVALRIKKSYRDTVANTSETLLLLGTTNITAISTGESSAFAIEKYRRANAAGGAMLIELNTSIEVAPGRVTINITQYNNGFSAMERSIELYSRR